MAIAHLCIRCGWDLARMRPVREPHYGLPVVTCPRCSRVTLRRRHPIWQRWHEFRRVDWSLTVVAIQVILLLTLGTITTFCIPAVLLNAAPLIGSELFKGRRSDEHEIRLFAWLCFWVFGVLGPITGAWLSAGFSHLRRWKVWASWAGFMLLIQLVLAGYFIVASSDADVFELGLQRTVVFDRTRIAVILFLAPGSMVLAGIMLAALVGIPAGRLLIWLGRYMRSVRWRWRRRRRKQTRTA